MYWWSDFDAGEVREEFAVIRALGFYMVRIFLLWEDWQPQPTRCPAGLQSSSPCAISPRTWASLDVTFFTGHMSGPSWAPHWMLRPDRPSRRGFARSSAEEGW